MNKDLTLKKLDLFRKQCESFGYRIVATNGCFDVLHIGHVRFLQKAKSYGDLLIVGINTDASIRKLKGNNRPIFDQRDRIGVLSAIEYVDFIVPFGGSTAVDFLRICRPSVWVKGGDWRMETLNEEEKKEVLVNGGTIQILPRMSEWSSTSVLKALEQ